MKTNAMDQNLFSLRTSSLWKSAKAFFFFFFLLIGAKTFAQYSGTGTFTKVTSAAGFTDGYYVVAYGTTQAMSNSHNGTFFAPTSISPTSGTTITNPSKAIVWKVETNGTGKSIYNEDANVFASYTGNSNNVQAVSTATTNNQRWSFNYSGGTFDVQNLGVSGRSLQYNTGAPRFACYTGSQQDITLYKMAASLTTYSLTYNGNNNTSGSVPATQTGSTSYNVSGNTGTLARTGYTWAGWTNNTAGTGTAYGPTYTTNSGTLTANTNFYARWAYTLTYDGNGNTGGAVPSTQTNYNSTTSAISGAGTLVRTGYTFGGWKTSASGTSADYTAGATYTPSTGSATRTLYAHWIPNVPTFNVTPTSLSGFTYVESNGPSGVQSFVLSGSNLENTASDPVELITFDGFEIAESTTGPWSDAIELPASYTGAAKTFYVRLKAGLTANNYSDTVLISGGGTVSGTSYAEVALSGTVTACLAPTIQSTVAPFTAVGINGWTVNLTAGNGVGRVAVINTANSFTNPISSNILPSANTVYGGSGQQVIYAGTGNSVAVTGLVPSTTYYVRVYEYNICSGNYTYNTTSVTNNPRSQATACDIPADPSGEVDLENPYCGSAALVYQMANGTIVPAGVTYYWQTSASGTSTANPVVFSAGATVSQPYTVTTAGYHYVRAYNGICWSTGAYTTQEQVVFVSAISIGTQPSSQSTVTGATATFSVTATGVSTYQWQLSTNGGTSWTNIAGATSATYTTPATTLAMNNYRYRVHLANACNTVNSNAATLSVSSGPCLSEDFQSGSIGYTTDNVTLDSGVWYFNDASIQNTSGRLEAQLRSATGTYISTPVFNSGVQSVSFKAFRTSGTGSALQVNYSIDGGDNWLSASESPYSLNTTLSNFNATINTTVPTIIRFYRTAGTVRLDDIEVTCSTAECTPATITAFPTIGPANTIVTITGTDFTTASTVKFGSANAVVQYISPTQIKATVPATADGSIVVDTALDCDSETAFTLITTDNSGCEGVVGGGAGVPATDIIFYEIYDENGQSGGTVSIYNGTGVTVDLSKFQFHRSQDYVSGGYTEYGILSGNLVAGGLAVIGVNTPTSTCNYPTTNNGSINGGFNGGDGFRLVKDNVTVDEVTVAQADPGYYYKRKVSSLLPKSTFDSADWDMAPVDSGQCLTGVATEPPVVKEAPIITAQPSYVLNCDVVNASLALTATEGLTGGNALAYQWYELKNTGAWTAVVDGGVYSGATTQTLTISDVNGLNNYQYYCQVRENTQTCYTATQATQIKEAANTWASNVWTNGTPVLGSKVIIAGSYNTQTNGTLDVCDLTINGGGTLRVRPNFPVTVKKKITNNGAAANLIVESDANLIQTDNVTNEGEIQVQRSVVDMNNDPGNAIDYVYWSSPVSGQTIKGTSGFSPNTPANGYLQYNESNDRFTVTNDATFQTGKGYAIRAEAGTDGYNKTYNFNGIPNNGNIQYQNLKWTDANHGFNLVGNPYPSNIDFDRLYQLNSAKMYSTVWYWTNNSYTASQAGSGYNGNNYAVYNGTGGSPATYNPEKPYDGSIVPDGKIKVGQAFIIQTKAGSRDQPLDFNNSIRVTDNANFYQKSTPKNRFWLNMTSPSNLVNTILVGYIDGATNNYETDFDGELFAVGSDSFYSTLGARKLAIQGKANNFSTDDVITLGNVFAVNGTYKIKLQTAEGIFEANQKVYLKDKVLNQYFDLSSNDTYIFTATKGTNNNRFEIVYKDRTLAVADDKKSEFQVYRNGENFVVQSSDKLGNVELYDAGGKLLRQLHSKENNIILEANTLPHGVYIIKAENSGNLRTKKVIK